MDGYDIENYSLRHALEDAQSLARVATILGNAGRLTEETERDLGQAQADILAIAEASVTACLERHNLERAVILEEDPRYAGGFSGGHIAKMQDSFKDWEFVQVWRRGEIPLVKPEPAAA